MTPMQSKDDVLVEEIHYLRQMLTDANEERNLQVAIVRDEVAEKQKIIEELTRRGAEAEASLRLTRKELDQLRPEHADRTRGQETRPSDAQSAEAPDAGIEFHVWRAEREGMRERLEEQRVRLERFLEESRQHNLWERELREEYMEKQLALREECAAKVHEAEVRAEAMSLKLTAHILDYEKELDEARACLARRDAHGDALAACHSEVELRDWEIELREATQLALQRVTDRRVELRVAASMDGHDTALCKICYDQPASCALLPCRHHAFCKPCARRIESGSDRTCPLCRTVVNGLFETYAS